MKSYNSVVKEAATVLNLPEGLVGKTYRAYWRAIKEYVSSLPLKEDLSDEEFSRLRPNVNIPSIGKLHVTPERYHSVKKSFSRIRQVQNN